MTGSEFHPDWVSPPGDTIADVLRRRNLSVLELCERLGYTFSEAQSLLGGSISISRPLAGKLAEVLGGSPEFWIQRDSLYRKARASYKPEVNEEEKDWLSTLPLQEMVKRGWIPADKDVKNTFFACLRFFDVPTVHSWSNKYSDIFAGVDYKRSLVHKSDLGTTAAWLRKGESEAASVVCKKWDLRGFEDSLEKIRRLTCARDPLKSLPELQSICAQNGVAVVVLKAPPRCAVNGATYFLSESKALLLLSGRYLYDDHFWFSFFHEAGHLILHGPKSCFIEEENPEQLTREDEANAFAASRLIPPEHLSEMLQLPLDGRAVIRFARKLGVAPGIVVGQLQHHGKIGRAALNNLKAKITWS